MPSNFIATLLIAASWIVTVGCTEAEPAPAAASSDVARSVRVASVANREIVRGISATGVLVARDEAMVGAEMIGFRVAEVLVDEGDVVTAGQPLVRLDDTLLRAQIGQLEANLTEQHAQLKQAESDVARGEALGPSGALPKATLDQQRFARDRWRAAVQAAEAHLAELKTRLSRMTIRAPVAGRVIERNVKPGEVASAGAMFRLTRDDLVELDAEIPERDLTRVALGAAATVTLPSNETIDGTVRLIDPAIDRDTKLGRARIALPVRADLRPGGFARVTIANESRFARMVPEPALRYSTDGPAVMVVGDDAHVRSVRVRTGQRDRGWVELLDSPEVGTHVIVGGAAFVLEGDRVQVAQQEAPTP